MAGFGLLAIIKRFWNKEEKIARGLIIFRFYVGIYNINGGINGKSVYINK